MKVLVDTCVWSLALRRKVVADNPYVRELKKLIEDYRAQMVGPIRQEILSGVRTEQHFEKLQMYLRAFTDLPIATGDYERAAACFNICRRQGIQGSKQIFCSVPSVNATSCPFLHLMMTLSILPIAFPYSYTLSSSLPVILPKLPKGPGFSRGEKSTPTTIRGGIPIWTNRSPGPKANCPCRSGRGWGGSLAPRCWLCRGQPSRPDRGW